MSFLLECPHCGVREVADFAFGGEVTARPRATPSFRELCEYNYFRRNVAGIQLEWWYHRSGCRTWFQAERDTRTNEVRRVGLPGQLEPGDPRSGDPDPGAPGARGASSSGAAT
jgi:heterotetrameric sarcosine oxidase delta subunit